MKKERFGGWGNARPHVHGKEGIFATLQIFKLLPGGEGIPAEMVMSFSAGRSRLSLAGDETIRKKLFPDWQNGDIAGKA